MSLISKKPGALSAGHPTDKGLQYWCEYIEAIRDAIGWDISLGADHFGRLTVNDAIRMCNAFEKYSLAYVEDLINYDTPDAMALNKKITDAVNVPTLNGEDMFGVEQFRPWIENHAVDIIHPDMETSGGILETKRIGDLAAEHGMQVMFHHAGSPIGAIASVHCNCTLSSFVIQENHATEMPWWNDLVTGLPKPIVQNGYIQVPEKPGLGLDLNDDVMKEHLRYPGYFEPTPQFDFPLVTKIIWQRGPYPHITQDGTFRNARDGE